VNEMAAPVVGIVGGIGSGKSTVAAEFAAHGGHLIAADRLGHEALREPGIKQEIVACWGDRVLDDAQQIDRKRLAAIVFADPNERRALEAMTHPYIKQRICEEIARARQQAEVRLIVLDAAVMLEAGWHDVCDHLVFVDAPHLVRLQRVKERGWSTVEVADRENAQMSLPEKRGHADAIVDNSGMPEGAAAQVREILAGWGVVCAARK
jgi:dephospho-CoA kinase